MDRNRSPHSPAAADRLATPRATTSEQGDSFASVAELATRLQADQRRRWDEGDAVRVEWYFDQFPLLRTAGEYAVDLVYSEFLIREEFGESPRADEYLQRFPEFAKELERQFAVHDGLAAVACDAGGDTSIATEPPANPLRSTGNSAAAELAAAPSTHQIGRFEVRKCLGMGAFGSVYRAFDPQLGREVALKVPHPHLLTDAHRERFLREARAAAQLRHPNLVAVYDSGVSEHGCFIAYQLVVGKTLADCLKERSFTPTEAAQLLCKLSQAAQHAHDRGVFHRDLKTANVLVDERGEPYISDFGLVRFEGDATLTTEAAILGTPAYMPPEQARGASHQADGRSDVYTLGIVLYELLTDRLPFVGPPQNVLRQVLEEEPPLVRALNRQVPRDLETICLKAMAKQPRDRYASAQALADDVGRWLRHEPIRAKPVSISVRLWKWGRRRPATAALVGVTLVAMLALSVLGAWYNIRLRSAHVETQKLLARTRQLLSHAQAERGVQLLAAGDSLGLLDLVEARGTAEGNRPSSDSRARLWAGWYEACRGRLIQMVGEDAPLSTAQFISNGSRLLTGSDRGAQCWELTGGSRSGDRMPHGLRVSVATDLSGNLVVTAPPDGGPIVWESETGKPLSTQFHGIENISDLAISPDGSLVAIASGSLVWLGTVATGEYFTEPLRHGGDVGHSLLFSNDAGLLATTTRSGNLGILRIWRIDRARQSFESIGGPIAHDQEIVAVAFNHDGTRIATASRDNTARIWDPLTGVPCGDTMRHREGVSAVAFSPDGTRLATASFDGTARIWNASTGKPIGEPLRHHGPVRAVAFSPDGNLLATGSLDGTIRLWHSANGQPFGWPLRHLGDVMSVTFSPDGAMLASASSNGLARIWNIAQVARENVRVFNHNSRVYSIALSPKDGRMLVTGSGDGAVRIYDWDGGDMVAEPWQFGAEILSVALSPTGETLACGPCGSGRNKVELRSVATSELVCEPLAIRGTAQVIAFSPTGKMLATGTTGGTVQCWDTATGRRRGSALPDESVAGSQAINALAFSPDGQLLAWASSDRAVQVWNVTTMKRHCAPLWHDGAVDALAFSPDGKRLATVSRDLAIRFWDAVTGQALPQTIHPEAVVQSMAFSPDGTILATASADGAARLWDIETGLPCGRPYMHDAFATAVAFNPYGDRLATGSFDKTARIWELPRHLGESNLELIRMRTGVALGVRLDSQGNVESIPWTEWQRMRTVLEARDR